jgi:F-type H+-transporting ATPase subunit delta
VRSPVFSAEVQRKRLSAVLDKAGISGTSAKFLKVLTANRPAVRGRRQSHALSDACVARFKGEATADVTVADSSQ